MRAQSLALTDNNPAFLDARRLERLGLEQRQQFLAQRAGALVELHLAPSQWHQATGLAHDALAPRFLVE